MSAKCTCAHVCLTSMQRHDCEYHKDKKYTLICIDKIKDSMLFRVPDFPTPEASH